MIKSNGKIEITREQAVDRALLCAKDLGHFYSLGRGGRKPSADRPYDKKGRVDCSGFVSWALGFDRFSGTGWWSTDGIYGDAMCDPGWYFRKVDKDEPVLPGDVLVYPDYRVNGVTKQGHTGIITHVLPGFKRGAPDWYKWLSVAHATPSQRLKHGNVVALTDARIWRKRGYIVRYLGFRV